jgi:opacity protein-like surface antigen
LRKYLLAAAAAAAIASPAAARDGSGYFGVEAGVLFPKDTSASVTGTYYYYYDVDIDADTDYKTGFDADLIAGYDFGLVRVEGELGWKRAKHKKYDGPANVTYYDSGVGDYVTYDAFAGDEVTDGETSVVSVMANVLLDFGNEDGLSFYAGGGAGWARTKYEFDVSATNSNVDFIRLSTKESGFAWQAIAGVRYAITPNMDVGLKYRYFRGNSVGSENFSDEFSDLDMDVGRFKSHSLLASLVMNFGAREAAPPPPPPVEAAPPPPPPPPATQTCPDGTVILATEACPAPPPPPPPPPPAPERG